MANQKGDTVSTGHFWNRCIDAVNEKFETYSFWHKASDCEFDDGENAQTKVGAIKGITSDLNTTTTGYAADMTTVSKLNSSLGTLSFGVDSDGNAYYKIGGADTEYPFKKGLSKLYLNGNYTINETTDGVILGNNGARGTTEGQYNITVIGVDVTDYSSLNFSISGGTAQGTEKYLYVYARDTIDGENVKTFTVQDTFNVTTTRSYSFDISDLTGFKFFVFYKASNGWTPTVNAGIVLKH